MQRLARDVEPVGPARPAHDGRVRGVGVEPLSAHQTSTHTAGRAGRSPRRGSVGEGVVAAQFGAVHTADRGAPIALRRDGVEFVGGAGHRLQCAGVSGVDGVGDRAVAGECACGPRRGPRHRVPVRLGAAPEHLGGASYCCCVGMSRTIWFGRTACGADEGHTSTGVMRCPMSGPLAEPVVSGSCVRIGVSRTCRSIGLLDPISAG